MPYQFQVHGAYVELRLFGELGPLEPFTTEEWDVVRSVKAILYNYDEVEKITYDPWRMAEVLRRTANRGIRMAAYASGPAWFGINRQLVQIAEVSEGSVRVFKDRPEAVAWLMHGDARSD